MTTVRTGIAARNLITALATALLASCASVPRHPIAPDLPDEANSSCKHMEGFVIPDEARNVAKQLKTRCEFHALAANPGRTVRLLAKSTPNPTAGSASKPGGLNAPLFLVGLEKPRNADGLHHCLHTGEGVPGTDCLWIGNFGSSRPLPSDTRDRARRTIVTELNDPRPSALTHIARFDAVPDRTFSEPCFLFNIYGQGGSCPRVERNQNSNSPLPQQAQAALDNLKASLSDAIRERAPTHIVVLSTGWNTYQFESIYNYRDWLLQFGEAAERSQAAKGKFRPIYVGVTWESTWTFVPKLLSEINKGNDADEIGFTWMGKVLNEVVLPAAAASPGAPQVVLIGHSFGARVVGGALFSKELLSHRGRLAAKPVDKLIALQGAFPLSRFEDNGMEPTWAQATTTGVPVHMFSSRFDQATSLFFLPAYAGGDKAAAVALANPARLALEVADESGRLTASGAHGLLTVVDASAFVNSHMPGTGGGAHSDVYDREMANAIIQVIFEH